MPDTGLVAAGDLHVFASFRTYVLAAFVGLDRHLHYRTVIRLCHAQSTSTLVGIVVWALRLIAPVAL